ncbi:hypothetical protein [Nocardioides sp. SYSU DS0651]|uniref:hypothetical protein n=1 Tax=Nocardioides sp. SYSU DS0651 TaxID=3415955 RepID=UPI003F4C88D5
MSLELTTALLLVGLAIVCWACVLPSRPEPLPVEAGPDVDAWRSAALRHFQEHRELQSTVVEALSTPGAVSGEARRELLVALGAPRVDVVA